MVSKVLGQSAFWIVNKELSKRLDIYPTLLLSDLIDKQEYFRARGELDIDGYFFNTSEDIEESTTLTYHMQKKCIKKLEESKLLDTKLKGMPAKVHFKVNEIKIWDFLNTSIKQTPKLVLEEFESNNNKSNNNIYITEPEFLEIWSKARFYYDKKETNISRLTVNESSNLKDLLKDYQKADIEKAIAGLFFQETLPNVRVRPTHLLDRQYFETYLDCWINKTKIYNRDKKKKNDNTGMI